MGKKFLKVALRIAAGIFRSQLIDFKWDWSEHKPIIEKALKDGYLEDEEMADILDHIADQL